MYKKVVRMSIKTIEIKYYNKLTPFLKNQFNTFDIYIQKPLIIY